MRLVGRLVLRGDLRLGPDRSVDVGLWAGSKYSPVERGMRAEQQPDGYTGAVGLSVVDGEDATPGLDGQWCAREVREMSRSEVDVDG